MERVRNLTQVVLTTQWIQQKNTRKSALSQLRILIRDTLGGLDRIVEIDPSERFRVYLWILAYTSLSVAMIVMCGLSIQTYLQYPVTTSINVKNQSFVKLPRISVCNVNPFKRQQLCSPPYKILCQPNINFLSAFQNFTLSDIRQKENENGLKSNSSNSTEILNPFEVHYTNAFYNLSDIVLACTVKGEPCAANLQDFFSPLQINPARFGRCFCMFCSNGHESDPRRFVTVTESPYQGIILILDARTETYLPHTRGSGFVLLFYSGAAKRAPEQNRHGVYVANGHATYMSVSAIRQNLFPSSNPDGCGDSWPDKYITEIQDIENHKYSNIDCHRICMNQQVIRLCGCRPTRRFATLANTDAICTETSETISCRDALYENPLQFRRGCRCPLDCTIDNFQIQATFSTFQRMTRLSSDRHRLRNITQVVIYYSTVEALHLQDAPAFTLLDAFAAVGGNMNTFTGLSFLLLFEFADVIVSWIFYILRRNQT